jgi:hypothetical protein
MNPSAFTLRKKSFALLLLPFFAFGIPSGCRSTTAPEEIAEVERINITDQIFTQLSNDCAEYENPYGSYVKDIQRNLNFEGVVDITAGDQECTIAVNGIPNHDFNDETAFFGGGQGGVKEVGRTFSIPRFPVVAQSPTALTQTRFDAVMRNGVVVDMLSAGCYRPNDPMANEDGDVQVGCQSNATWLVDPLGTDHKFGADQHNAHTQPDGTYHYHGDPKAMFDDQPGENGSPIIGFAADGFPVFGSFFKDPITGQVRKAVPGYSLKEGSRPGPDAQNPGGEYDGRYLDDYEFTGDGDLDECNGMTVNGVYGYYVTDTYPWMLKCHKGTPDPSFNKGMPKAQFDHGHRW